MHATQRNVQFPILEHERATAIRLELPPQRLHVTIVKPGNHDLLCIAANGSGHFRMCGRRDDDRHVQRELELLAQHTRDVAQPFEMFLPDGRDHRDIGRDDRSQACNFAGHVGAGLDHGQIGVIRHGQQRERHTDLVVQIARRRMHLVRPGQHRRQHRLRAGLAIRAADRNHRLAPGATAEVCQGTQRDAGVVHHVDRHAKVCCACGIVDDERRRAGCDGVGQKIMRVELLALKRDKERIGHDEAGVGADAAELARAARQRDRGARLERRRHAIHGPEGATGRRVRHVTGEW